ncbi:hypothetical protein PIB30_090633 [Stylosanthes scabra]|uniref:Uncharacterized protein n=1 Tax=Stylosanthes scabra TaxID=79078 RepID=A0ABU6QTQ9_9FABA|nr:hypothetical protein [Stylosanthes scabra]
MGVFSTCWVGVWLDAWEESAFSYGDGAAGGGMVGATCEVPGLDVEGEGEGVCFELGAALPLPRPRPRDDCEDPLPLADIFHPDNNVCTQAISDVIELMLNELWINYSEILADV